MKNNKAIKILSVIFVYFLAMFITVFTVKSGIFQGGTPDGEKEHTEAETQDVSGNANDEMGGIRLPEWESITETEEDSQETTEDIAAENTAAHGDPSETDEGTEGETQTPDEEVGEELEQPPEFVRIMEKSGCDINSVECNQLVIVESSGSSAAVHLYEKDSSGLWCDAQLTVYGWVGSNGVDEKSQEGDYKTPSGLYSIGDAFYIYDQPQTGLSSFQVTDQTYWVDDPNSVYYNQRVEGTDNKDWNSAEHMISYTQSYKYGFVVNFNMDPIVPGKGSAIFFHCGSGPTAGCVAVPESSVLSYLERLDKNKNPYILMM